MVPIIFIVVAGGGLAAFVFLAMMIASRERERDESAAVAAPQRDSVAASLLYHVVAAGGASDDDALRQIRRGVGLAAPVTRGIDVTNWAETYARHSSPEQRRGLLETAVQLVAARSPVPVGQYAALLDLSFGLGFQTDALARLRELYGFEYVDHAKDGRPRNAEHAPLFARDTRPREDLLRILGMTGTPTRSEVSAAYRKLVSQHHPDRYHGAPAAEQAEAAARFIEITRAYEELVRTL
jgi:DnaJ domain